MLIKLTKLAAVMLLVGVFALVVLGSSPVSAALAPAGPLNSPSNSLNSNSAVTSTVTVTPTKAVTPTVGSTPTSSTARVTPTSVPPTATATKAASTATVTPTVAVATATNTVAPATATKTVTPTVVPATVTKTATPVPPTATKTATPASRLAPRAAAGVPSQLSTAFVVQNMDPVTTATVVAQFYNTSGQIVNSVTVNPGPNKAAGVDQRFAGGGLDCGTLCNSPWNGSVVLSSNTQIAAIVNEVSGNSQILRQSYRQDSYNGASSIVAANTVLLPQLNKSVYDSTQLKTYNSTIAIQNTSLSASTNVTVTYYNVPVGSPPVVQNVQRNYSNVAAGSSLYLRTDDETTFNPWIGAAKITSDQPVAVIVNQNADGGLGIYSGFTSANAAPSAPYQLYVPQIAKSVQDTMQGYWWGSAFVVMTQNQSTAEVYVTYTNAAYNPPHVWTDHKTASPFAVFDQRSDAALGDPFAGGSATITSTVPIIAIVNMATNYDANRGGRTYSYRAVPAGAGTAKSFIPQLLKYFPDTTQGVTLSTAVAGQYMGTDPSATIRITYTNYNGATTFTEATVTPGNPFFAFDQRTDTHLSGPNWSTTFASAVVTSTNNQPFTTIVNVVGGGGDYGDAASNYAGISQ